MLNGSSSAGKTSVARALQAVMDAPYLRLGVDEFLPGLPPGLVVAAEEGDDQAHDYFLFVHRRAPEAALAVGRGEGLVPAGHMLTQMRLGPGAITLFAGMYHAFAAMAEQGVNLIVESIIYEPRVLRVAVRALHDLPVLMVGLRTPLHEAQRRERERGDRLPGLAAAFHDAAHAHGIYDLEFDTALATPMECALQIKRALDDGAQGRPRTALRQLVETLGL
jgi:chloramphenicol 3-O phosphotransferase